MRVRQRDQISGKVSDWSGVLTFNTNQLAECDDTVTPPIDKVFQEVSCRESVPAGETEEDETEEETETGTGDKEDTGDPSPGPDTCFGSGCGESEDGDTGSNPNNPGSWPCCQTNPGCIGPGCSTGSGPTSPGGDSGGGNEGSPGGPSGPEGEKPPSLPPVGTPTCEDDSVHVTSLEVENQDDTESVVAIVKWSKDDRCQDYLKTVNATAGLDVAPSSLNRGWKF